MSAVRRASCSGEEKLRANNMTPPASGCASRRRSSSSSSVPATSSITGPSGCGLRAMTSGFQDDAGAGEARLVADCQMVADYAAIAHQLLELRMKCQAGLAGPVLHYADALQGHRIPEACAHGLREGFF